MKKINVILICAIIALVSGIVGFLIGINMKDGINLNKTEKNLVGTYKTNTWNGKEAVLVLYEDKTCIHPSGSKGTWSLEEKTLHLDIECDYTDMYEQFGMSEENARGIERKEATIVDKGIMINTHFFEKVK